MLNFWGTMEEGGGGGGWMNDDVGKVLKVYIINFFGVVWVGGVSQVKTNI